jgi:uncharacterized membrane protein
VDPGESIAVKVSGTAIEGIATREDQPRAAIAAMLAIAAIRFLCMLFLLFEILSGLNVMAYL